MRVIVVEHDMSPNINRHDPVSAESHAGFPRSLPPAAEIAKTESQLHPRAVRGEILSDESGRLYERLGSQIRPLHRLASGPSGEVIDLVPADQSHLRMIALPKQPQISQRQKAGAVSLASEAGVQKRQDSSHFIPLQKRSTEKADTPAYRKLFVDPGQWRVLWWGDFKDILSEQLLHPERLRDAYRLPCYIQVFETEREILIEDLAKACASENHRQARLYFLTDEIAAKLDLTSLLPADTEKPYRRRQAQNTLLARDRVFRLLVANDPTIDVAAFKSKSHAASKPDGRRKRNLDDLSSTGPPKAKEPSQVPDVSTLKTAIPNAFLNEWEFKISREEAVYDLNSTPGVGSFIRSFVRRLRVIKLRNDFRRWHVLLLGKTYDEQLWSVRPPVGARMDPLIREWAKRTLEVAGYDSAKMILEWEIFWRRKGI